MPRYFLELAYKGTRYSGFQIQENAVTVQWEMEKAMGILYRQPFSLTGSSRTDAGVHAAKNYFHFDTALDIDPQSIYHLNAILPPDIVVKIIQKVKEDAHCRFNAIAREYEYYIYQQKDPFKADRAWFYPYALDLNSLQETASLLLEYRDFTSFSKRNTQVNNFNCTLEYSYWEKNEDFLVYRVKANRFLRGMIRGLVGTMVKTARGKITADQFRAVIASKDCTKADFTSPAHGLFLINVIYPESVFSCSKSG